MNLVWLKLIKRILTHKYYVAKFSFTEFSRAIKYWDDGTKNSLKGLIKIEEENGNQQTKDAELQGCLKTVFVDGELVREYSLSEIRERVNSTLV